MTLVEIIAIPPTTLTLTEGEKKLLTAVVYPTNATTPTVSWSSSNQTVASVGEDGLVYANNAGTARIYARAIDGSGVYDFCTVTVEADVVPVSEIILDKTEMTLTLGESGTLTATVLPQNATNKNYSWGSMNESVAKVDSGVVTAMGVGTTTVYATTTSADNVRGACTISVTPAVVPVSEIMLDKTEMTLTLGESGTLTATVLPQNATNKNYSWGSMNESVAKVDGGVVTAMGVGTTTVYATTTSADNVRGVCAISVTPTVIPVESVTVSPSEKVMTLGDEPFYLSATVLPVYATNSSLKWTSKNPEIAAVNTTNGLVFALREGVTTITAIAQDGSEKGGGCVVTVDGHVIVEKDGAYFNVVFSNGTIWKSIECDLEVEGLSEDYSRMNYNCTQTFSKKQLAYLYLLDPLGVEFYMKYYKFDVDESMTLEEKLYFKDDLYKEVFGVEPRFFRKVNDVVTFEYIAEDVGKDIKREDCLSDAELVFGAHPIWDGYVLTNVIFTAVYDLFVLLSDSWIGLGAEIVRALFFSASVTNALLSGTPSVAVDYLDKSMGQTLQTADKVYGWVSFIVDIIESVANSALPDCSDKIIHQKVQDQALKTYFKVESGAELSFKEVIERYITYIE